jgi:hypothetical protein
MKQPVPRLSVEGRQEDLDAFAAASDDVRAAGRVEDLELRLSEHPEPAYDVEL